MSNQGYTAKGIKFTVGKYRIRIYWTLIDISDGMTGRVRWFPWSKFFWR